MPERKAGYNIDEYLRLYQGNELGTKKPEEYRRDDPVPISQRQTKVLIGDLPGRHTVSPFPGKEDVHPVREIGKKRYQGQSNNDHCLNYGKDATLSVKGRP
jgi:hypothetical protein